MAYCPIHVPYRTKDSKYGMAYCCCAAPMRQCPETYDRHRCTLLFCLTPTTPTALSYNHCGAYMRACVRVCVRVCVYACMRVCVRACWAMQQLQRKPVPRPRVSREDYRLQCCHIVFWVRVLQMCMTCCTTSWRMSMPEAICLNAAECSTWLSGGCGVCCR